MSKITIELNTDNAAFEENPSEVSRILRLIADRADDGAWETMTALPLSDGNGNRVGTITVED